jgi:hypothetical protein
LAESLRKRMINWIGGGRGTLQPAPTNQTLASVSARVDDAEGYFRSPGWAGLSQHTHEYDPAQVQELYNDALTAWRKNPIAFRIIAITTDYVVGDAIRISSPLKSLERFIQEFWHHPKNRMDLRLEAMCEELARSGDLFVLLFRNPADGMSYVRFVTKDCIERIETAENDWETELVYVVRRNGVSPNDIWLAPAHPEAAEAPAVMLHYAVNRPVGALLGESDLTTMLPWLQRYSRMLEDRVRLHWAMRLFLWIVTVPTNTVREKQEQYRVAPDAGSIIVKDESEQWQAQAPTLHGADASHDLEAVRGMIDAGSGYPPHWRGESGDANLATATAMQAPTERHLLRRQQYFGFILQDLLYQAYQRAVQVNRAPRLRTSDYSQLFTLSVADISRSDNEALARAAQSLVQALSGLKDLDLRSPTLSRLALRMLFKFAGEPQSEEMIERIYQEMMLPK